MTYLNYFIFLCHLENKTSNHATYQLELKMKAKLLDSVANSLLQNLRKNFFLL